MNRKETEWVKIKLPRTLVSQISTISKDLNMDFEEYFTKIVSDGLYDNNPDFIFRNEVMKKGHLDKKILECCVILRKKCLIDLSNCTPFDKLLHFYALIEPFFRKKTFTQSELISVNKVQQVFIFVKDNFPDEFEEFKKAVCLHHRTKVYKLLFPVIMTTSSKSNHELVSSRDNKSVMER